MRARGTVVMAEWAIALVITCGSARVRANGAFPDTQTVLLPAEHPDRIILAANFGLIFTEDGGGHWEYACERTPTTGGRLYAVGPGPDERLFSLSAFGTVTSADLGCTWKVGGGPFDGGLVLDYFADPVDPRHVLVVAEPPGPSGQLPAAVFASQDGGLSYGPALFTAPAGGGITGVEIARTDSAIIYLTVFTTVMDTLSHPALVRSNDGGASWQTIDLEPSLGPSRVRIAGIDPTDANRLYLRASGTNAQMRSVDSIAVSADGGQTFAKPVNLTGGTLISFLARRDGTVLVSGLLGATVVGYRSLDAGMTFSSWQPGLHPRGFGERGSTLFVAADNAVDGFALASSEDQGDTWTPRLRFQEIAAVKACVYRACVQDCTTQASQELFPPAVCADRTDAGPGSDEGPTPAAKASGCSACSAAGTAVQERSALVAVAFLLAWALGARPRKTRPGSYTDGPPCHQPLAPSARPLGAYTPCHTHLATFWLRLLGLMVARRSRRGRHRRPARVELTLLLVVSLLGGTAPAFGYSRSRTTAGAAYLLPTRCLPIEVHLGGLPGVSETEMRAAALGAARVWTGGGNACTDLTIALSFVEGPGPLVGNDGVNVVGARSDGWCAAPSDPPAPGASPTTCNAPSASAATSVFVAPGGRILGGDTELNTITMSWGALDQQGQPADKQDLQSTLTHEIGHLIGLDHPCWSGIGPRGTDDHDAPVPNCYGAPEAITQDTMFPTIDPGDISRRSLSSDTQRAVCEIYPAAAAASPVGPVAACPTTAGGCSLVPPPAADSRWSLFAAGMVLLIASRRGRAQAMPNKARRSG